MYNPFLYKIGLNNECFGNLVMFKWIMYGLFHAFFIYYIGFEKMQYDHSGFLSDGKDIGFWISGHVVYGSCIIVANIVIVHQANTHTLFSIGSAVLGVLAFFVILGFENFFMDFFYFVYGIFGPMFTSIRVWARIIFICMSVSVLELVLHYIKMLKSTDNQTNRDIVKSRSYSMTNYNLIDENGIEPDFLRETMGIQPAGGKKTVPVKSKAGTGSLLKSIPEEDIVEGEEHNVNISYMNNS